MHQSSLGRSISPGPAQASAALHNTGNVASGVGNARPGRDEDKLSSTPLAGLRILLVEDDPEVREITEMVLTAEGATVTATANAIGALAVLRGPQPLDLLFSDVVLPDGISGIDLVEAASHMRPSLPALLASGYISPAQQRGRAALGRVRLLPKPYRHAELLSAIAGALSPR